MIQPLPKPPRPVWQAYLALLLPMILTNMLQSASGAIDRAYIGQLLGVDAIAAVSAFFPVMFLLLSVAIGLSSGATVLVGQAWGAGGRDRVRAIAGTALAMMLAAGLVLGCGGALVAADLMRWLGTPAEVQATATAYAQAMLMVMPAIFVLWLVTSISRGTGDAVTPLAALAIMTVCSLFLTPALILGWAGLPRLGVVGSALSTLVAALAGLLWLALYWRHRGHPLAPSLRGLAAFRFERRLAALILRMGVPTALQMMAMAVAEIALIGLVNRHGPDGTASYGAINLVMSWVQFPIMSLSITASILTAQAVGAGRPERIGAILRAGLWLNLASTGAIVLLVHLFARPVLGLFLDDVAVAAMAAGLMRLMLWSLVLMGAASLLSGIMRGTGTVLWPAGLSMFAILGIEIPLAWLLEPQLGLPAVWIGYAACFVATPLLQGLYFMLVWRRRAVRRLL
ncbi:MATE family efflux transporter [Ferrovibrio sp.]|uniref:MATE family efflux transporter n=2 Tax=Ferrovibrio sp. TaxID=1917215 RepID=UPI003513A0C4